MSGDETKEPVPEIVVIKRGRAGEDGHHGGVWKIAYADFMTAMMAFFLVMWLVNAANEKTKSQVASYFNPVKLIDTRTSEKGLQSMDTGDGQSWDKRDTAGVSKTPPNREKKRPARTWQTPLAEPRSKPQPKRSSGSVLKDPFVVGLNGGDTSEHQGQTNQPGGKDSPNDSAETPNAEAARVLEALLQHETAPAGENPNQGMGEKPAIGAGDKPNVGMGEKPAIGAGDKPNVGMGEKPDIGAGDKPNVGMGEKPDIGVGEKPNVGIGEKPDIGVGQDPETGPSNKPGKDAGNKKVAKLPSTVGGALESSGGSANTQASGLTAETEVEMQKRLTDASEEIQRKLTESNELGSVSGVNVTVSAHAEGSLISLVEGEEHPMFGIATSTPSQELRATVRKVATALKDVEGDIVVRGHTDGRAYFTADSDNWRLSSDRAHAAYRLLVSNGIASSRFVRIEGYADTVLKVQDQPNAAQNRRIEILLKNGSP
ncbi:MAG: flagellar motor protein MotB [Anderseniella sp.]